MILIYAVGIILFAAVALFFWASSPNKNNPDYILKLKGPATKTKKKYKLITYNMGFASGKANNKSVSRHKKEIEKNLKSIIELVKKEKPDFLVLQEVDIESDRTFNVDQVKKIAKEAGHPHVSFMCNWSKNYVPFPYWPPSVHYGKVNSGQAVLSKYSIIRVARHELPQSKKRAYHYNKFYLNRLIQEVTINLGKEELTIFNIHLEAFDKANRMEHAAILQKVYKSAEGKNALIAGDFNCPFPYASRKENLPAVMETEFENDNTVELFINDKSLKPDTAKEKYLKYEFEYFTFQSWRPFIKLDHIFVTKKIKIINSGVVTSCLSSDHLPLKIHFKMNS